MYVLDTNVVSELRMRKPHGAVVAWTDSVRDEQLHLSAVALGETHAEIVPTKQPNPHEAACIEAWADLVAQASNIIPMDAAAFRVWAKLMHRVCDTVYEDAMIAATELVH